MHMQELEIIQKTIIVSATIIPAALALIVCSLVSIPETTSPTLSILWKVFRREILLLLILLLSVILLLACSSYWLHIRHECSLNEKYNPRCEINQ